MIELLVVISLILSVGSVFALKGAHFLKSLQKNQETSSLCHILSRFYLVAQISQKPIVLSLNNRQGDLEVSAKDQKFSKKFRHLKFDLKIKEISFYPGMLPSIEALGKIDIESNKKIYFDAEKNKFFISKN